MLEDLLALVAPPACAICGDGCEVRTRLCERCDRALRAGAPVRSAAPGMDEAWSAAAYDGTARHLVAALLVPSPTGVRAKISPTDGGLRRRRSAPPDYRPGSRGPRSPAP